MRTSVPVSSLAHATEVATRAITACGAAADDHLRVDLRADRVFLTLGSSEQATVELAQLITVAVPETEPYGVQLLEIAIDALDIPAIRPFWKAVLAYTDEGGADGPRDPIVDPDRLGPAIWFQQMSEPRPQRNRIHFDVSVAHDEAAARIEAALKAGGRLVSGERAPAFWVLADAEGNEACITTWQGRD
ncbi:hypothetical protein Asi03nite_25470 [Actinoplanes siamensis]|uniref:Glyoxalase-like domain-containing protein n=1 Tax=Actinoplanes siamensis TaxID=1223317 RepID=A0A919N639_9ACTN|nr:hypothetical protein Asi03nite_25470 [Actinoplanes siamensis]